MIKLKKVIGITGGIACGKSTITNYLKAQGYFVLNADVIAKELSEMHQPVYKKIVEAFGREYLKDNLELDREKLGKLIFQNTSARIKLNRISHPIIVEEIQKKIKNATEKLIFLELPLLFEAKLMDLCDTIVCVYVSKETQMQRLMKRDQISYTYAMQKIESQLSLDEKRQQSDYCILAEDWNATYPQIEKILKEIKGEIKNGSNC